MRVYASPKARTWVGASSAASGALSEGVAAAATGAWSTPSPSKPEQTTSRTTSARQNFIVFTALLAVAVIPVHPCTGERTRLRTGKLKRGSRLARPRLFSTAGSRRDDSDRPLRRRGLGLPTAGDQRQRGHDLQRSPAPRGNVGRRGASAGLAWAG